MNILELIKSEKKVSSLNLEERDIIFEVWEMGMVIAKILETCFLIRPPLKEGRKEGFLINNVASSLYRLVVLYKKLSEGEKRILGWTEDLDKTIKGFSIEDTLKRFEVERIESLMHRIEELIICELKSQSPHLSHIFSFSLALRRLKTGLLYQLEIEGRIETLIKDSLRLLEMIRLGDKVLVSPHMELSNKNLRIIESRIKGWSKALEELRRYSKEIGDNSKEKTVFIEKIEKTCDMWTELILDIKNPSDYLRLSKRFLNVFVPAVICYYLVAIFIVFIPWNKLETMSQKVLGAPFSVLALAICIFIYKKIKNFLEIRCFGFKASDFKKCKCSA